MEWSQEETLELIELYRKNDLLWDAKHPKYFNRNRKNDAWDQIAKKMNRKAEECRKKIAGLLASLRREKGKINKSTGTGAGADEMYVYESSWYAFKSLQFLWHKDKPRDRSSTISNEDQGNVEPPATDVENVVPPQPNWRKRKLQADDILEKALCILEKSETQIRDDDDECEIFGRLTARKLKNYSPITRSTVQQAIMNVLCNADRGLYDQSPHPYPKTSETITSAPYARFNATLLSESSHSLPSPSRSPLPSPNHDTVRTHPSPALTSDIISYDIKLEDLI